MNINISALHCTVPFSKILAFHYLLMCGTKIKSIAALQLQDQYSRKPTTKTVQIVIFL